MPPDEDGPEDANAPSMGQDRVLLLALEGGQGSHIDDDGDDYAQRDLVELPRARPPRAQLAPRPTPPQAPTHHPHVVVPQVRQGYSEFSAVLKNAAQGVTKVRLGELTEDAAKRGVVAVIIVMANGERIVQR